MKVFDCHSWLGGSIVPGVGHTPTALTTGLDHYDVQGALLMSAHARLVDPLAGNRLVKAALEQSEALYGCLVAHVNRVQSSLTAMRELMPLRRFLCMALVGSRLEEPVPYALADEILNAYRRYTKPLFVFALNGASVEAAQRIATGYPMLRVVLVGMGGPHWPQAIKAAHATTNLMLETSGVLDRAKVPAAVDTLGGHRLVFGSGSPATSLPAALGMIEDASVTDDVKRRVLWDNAIRLFELEQPRPEETA